MERSRGEVSDLLRTAGGVLFAVGATVVLIRKSGPGGWSDLSRVVVVFVPATVLYLLAFEPPAQERARPWQSVFVVLATLLTPVVLFEVLHWIGASTRHRLYDMAVFALTGVIAAYASRRARVTYSALLAGLSSLVAWLFLWSKILHHPSANTFRWLLVAGAAILLLLAARFARTEALAAGEVAIVGGIAAVAAGIFGVLVSAFVAILGRLSSLTTVQRTSSGEVRSRSAFGSEALSSPTRTRIHTSGVQHLGWDIYLLVIALALVWIGSRMRVRGLGYVGAVGLGAFIISVGVQLTRLQAGHGPTHAVLVWPLILIIGGVVALVVSSIRVRKSSD